MQPRGADGWQPVRTGLQMVFFAWLINAAYGFLHGVIFNVLIDNARGGGESTWKLLDRLSIFAGFTDLAATLVMALGILLVARAPAPAGAGKLATGAFGCAIGSLALSFFGFVQQVLEHLRIIRDPLFEWKTARYVYLAEALLFVVVVGLFVVACLKLTSALRASDATWKGVVAMAVVGTAVLLAWAPVLVNSLSKFRVRHNWEWFFLTRGMRAFGDVMMLLFVSHLLRAARRPSPSSPY